MPTSTSAVNDAVQIALSLLGLVVLACYFLHPKFKAWRTATTPAPPWCNQISDTMLLFAVVLGALFLGSSCGYLLARLFPGGTEAGSAVQILGGNIGMFTAVPVAIALGAFYLRTHGTPVAPLNAPGAPAPLDALGIGFLTFLGAAPLVLATMLPWTLLLQAFNYTMVKQPVVELLFGDSPAGVRLGLVLMAVVLAPITEELVFRAGLFRFLRSIGPRWVAITLSSVIFATLHFNVTAFLPLVVLGAIWAHVYERSGSIVVTIIAHGLFNLTTIALMLSNAGALG